MPRDVGVLASAAQRTPGGGTAGRTRRALRGTRAAAPEALDGAVSKAGARPSGSRVVVPGGSRWGQLGVAGEHQARLGARAEDPSVLAAVGRGLAGRACPPCWTVVAEALPGAAGLPRSSQQAAGDMAGAAARPGDRRACDGLCPHGRRLEGAWSLLIHRRPRGASEKHQGGPRAGSAVPGSPHEVKAGPTAARRPHARLAAERSPECQPRVSMLPCGAMGPPDGPAGASRGQGLGPREECEHRFPCPALMGSHVSI